MSLFVVVGPIIRGEQSFWWIKEYYLEYQKWSFWNSAIIFYFYFVFYGASLDIIWEACQWYKYRDFYPSEDPFYSKKIPRDHVLLYQHYCRKAIFSIDNDTILSQMIEHNLEKYLDSLVIEAVREGLNAEILKVMLNQYLFADDYRRENDKGYWVKRVMNRKDVDYFPSAYNVIAMLDSHDP